MSGLKVLIVDDEPLAIKRMNTLLNERDDIEIVGECANGHQAIKAIQEQKPDLVFLDIQMPEIDGFGVIESTLQGHCPAVVFVTAFNEHAVRAFDVNAVDYLLKPFDSERLNKAIDRAKKLISVSTSERDDIQQKMLSALEQYRQRDFVDRLAVKVDTRIIFLEVSRIQWIEAAGKHVRLHTADETYLLRESMQMLEQRLDPNSFVRIHRSTIVKLDEIESFEPLFHGEYTVTLKNGQQLTLSRSYRAKLRERFGNLI